MNKKKYGKILSFILVFMLLLSNFIGAGALKTVHAEEITLINEGFDAGTTAPSGWTFNNTKGTYTSSGNFGASSPSLKLDSTGCSITTSVFSNPSQLSFWIKGNGTDGNSSLKVEGFDGTNWSTIEDIKPLPTAAETKTYKLSSNIVQIRFTYTKSAGNLAFDDVIITGTPVQTVVPVEGVSLNKKALSLPVGTSETLLAAISPENATNKKVTWTSSNPETASVEQNTGAVTGVAEGEAAVTVTTDDGNFTDTCTVTVTPRQEPDEIPISEARGKDTGSSVTVKGIVTFIDTNSGGSTYFIQDSTAGIALRIPNTITGVTLSIGDEVKATGKLGDYNGLLQLTPDTSNDVEVISTNNSRPEPKVITISGANSDNYESQLIKINNAVIGAVNTIGNTEITDATGKINIYKIPELTDIKEGDSINVTAIVSQFKSYQLRVKDAADITKVDLGPDTQAPVISHEAITTANINSDLTVTAAITDDRQVIGGDLYYRTKGAAEFKKLSMVKQSGDAYSAVIPKSDLSIEGLEYYIEAMDGTNTATLPVNKEKPIQVTITNEDVIKPEVSNLKPASGSNTGNNKKPEISADYSDASGIDVSSIKLFVDDKDVTSNAAINESHIAYTPIEDLSIGEHMARLEVSDKKNNKVITIWNFSVGEEQYNLYFGQIHSHTNYSDGQGSPEDAYSYAKNTAKADFFAVTDHSNSLDNDTKATLGDGSASTEWKNLKQTADKYNEAGKFAAIAGYEMTWSGSTGGWGHMNTFNTDGFLSRNSKIDNKLVDLPMYYNEIKKYPQSIAQMNHPGDTFGDFGDFGYYDPQVDRVVTLIEVGNGEGMVRGKGYFPSYNYYTRALDKGWHLAPTNNQDNHKGNWISANTARTVVLAPELTRDSIYDGLRNMRIYATEDSNLRIMYKVNGQVMGSILSSPPQLNISIDIEDPDQNDNIGKVSIISNGGAVVASKTFDSNKAKWELELSPQYSYYYVRVDEADKDIAVTAPVWSSEVVPVGISKVEVSQNPQIINTPTDIKATIYNNAVTALSNVKVEFFKDSISDSNKIGEQVISAISPSSSGTAAIKWSPDKIGKINIYAQAVINVQGQDKTFTESTIFTVANQQDIIKVVIDAGHENQYVTGDYPGNIKTLSSMMMEKGIMLVQNNDELTSSDLENTKILILTDPSKTKNYSDAEIKVISDYVKLGGSLIITSRADYNDKGLTDPDLNSAAQGNRVLEAIGSNLIFNDDEVIDKTSNGGQEYRLYFDKYTSTKYNLTGNIVPGYTYSAYSGCSVVLKNGGNDEKVDWLVKGHDTTESLDSDLQNDAASVEKGNVYVLAAEILSSGSKVIVAGTTFFSDFETATADNAYSNKQITNNIIDWMTAAPSESVKKIADIRLDENKDGVPDLLGQKFTVEGIVTAQSVGVGTNNAFFDVIYVQDETGGITVFGVSTRQILLGTKIKVTGTVGQYEGDFQLAIKDENKDVEILSSTPNPVAPKVMTTGETMLKENEGWLVKTQGIVKRINTEGGDNSIYIDDGSGEAKVYVNGYIGDGTANNDMLGKWDPEIKVGDTVSAIGLASQDAAGHRIRVRNTAEIVKVTEEAKLDIEIINPVDLSEGFRLGKDAKVEYKVTNSTMEAKDATLIMALFDNEDRFISYAAIKQTIEAGKSVNLFGMMKMPTEGQYTVRCFVWDTLEQDGMKPLSRVIEIPVRK